MRRVIVAMAGLPGSGKSTIALALGKQLGLPVLDKDVVLSSMLETGLPVDTAQSSAYAVMFGLVRSLVLDQGQSVIFDTPLAVNSSLVRLRRLADDAGAGLIPVLCLADRELRNRRVADRAALPSQPVRSSRTIGDGRDRSAYLPVDTLIADTAHPIPILVDRLSAAIRVRVG